MKSLFFVFLLGFSSVSLAETPVQNPLAWKDSASDIVFYVESDGVHASAIDKDGKLLWCIDLPSAGRFVKRATKIDGLSVGGKEIRIEFGDTDSVYLDIATGKVAMVIHD